MATTASPSNDFGASLQEWRRAGLHQDLNHPVLDHAYLTFGERIQAFIERHDVTWKSVSAVALMMLTTFGLWYAGFPIAAGVVGLVTVIAAMSRKTGMESWDLHDLCYNRRYCWFKERLSSSKDTIALHTCLREFTAYSSHVLGLALVLRMRPDLWKELNTLQVTKGPDHGRVHLLHWMTHDANHFSEKSERPDPAKKKNTEVCIRMMIAVGANPNIRGDSLRGAGEDSRSDASRETALEMARRHNLPEIVQLFETVR